VISSSTGFSAALSLEFAYNLNVTAGINLCNKFSEDFIGADWQKGEAEQPESEVLRTYHRSSTIDAICPASLQGLHHLSQPVAGVLTAQTR
jgi:hypothetical protein